MRIRVFRYIEEVDAFDVTEQYASLVDLIGLAEWNPVVWIGRYFSLDNDFGEHWFDNWDARESRRELAEKHGLDPDKLLVIDPERFRNGADGPCHSPEMRMRFWHDVLSSLELTPELLFDEAREFNRRTKVLIEAGAAVLGDGYIPDLEDRIERWQRDQRAGEGQ